MAKDLFADSTMSFGEHLEALRSHLFRCVVYLLVACVPAAFFAEDVLDLVTAPINAALLEYDPGAAPLETGAEIQGGFLDNFRDSFEWTGYWDGVPRPEPPIEPEVRDDVIEVSFPKDELRAALGLPPVADAEGDELVVLALRSDRFRGLAVGAGLTNRLVTNDLMEPFLIYIKAILITAFAASSPLIFTELWLFVGAGLYPHERKYVYLYVPVSLLLFFSGAAFCFAVVFQFVLPFLLSFNDLVETVPVLQAGRWFNFALVLPAMFGLSFQLPLVMLGANRLGIVPVEAYWTNLRFAVLAIAGASMLLTPSDPGSMIAMMIPLTALYFVGIAMCNYFPSPAAESPFAEEAEREKIHS